MTKNLNHRGSSPTISDNRRRASTLSHRSISPTRHHTTTRYRGRPAPREDHYSPCAEFFVSVQDAGSACRPQLAGIATPVVFYRVAAAIAEFSKRGVPAYGSVLAMAKKAQCSENTFRKWARIGADLGMWKIERRPGEGAGALPNLYSPKRSPYWGVFRPSGPYVCGKSGTLEGGAKRNSEPKFQTTTTVTVQTREDLFKPEIAFSSTDTATDLGKGFSTKAEPKNKPENPNSESQIKPEAIPKPHPCTQPPFTADQVRAAVAAVFRWSILQTEAASIAQFCPAALAKFSIHAVLYALTRKYPLERPDLIETPGAFVNAKVRTLTPADVAEDQRLWELKCQRDARLSACGNSRAGAQVAELAWLAANPAYAGELAKMRDAQADLPKIRESWAAMGVSGRATAAGEGFPYPRSDDRSTAT